MKLLTTTLLLTSLSVAIFAESPVVIPLPENPIALKAKVEKLKKKRLKKINTRLANMEKRKVCMGDSNSLKEMQMCRIKKNQHKAFKLKKGMTFEEKKNNKLAKIAKHMEKVKNLKACIESASTVEGIKSCKIKKVTLISPR